MAWCSCGPFVHRERLSPDSWVPSVAGSIATKLQAWFPQWGQTGSLRPQPVSSCNCSTLSLIKPGVAVFLNEFQGTSGVTMHTENLLKELSREELVAGGRGDKQ